MQPRGVPDRRGGRRDGPTGAGRDSRGVRRGDRDRAAPRDAAPDRHRPARRPRRPPARRRRASGVASCLRTRPCDSRTRVSASGATARPHARTTAVRAARHSQAQGPSRMLTPRAALDAFTYNHACRVLLWRPTALSLYNQTDCMQWYSCALRLIDDIQSICPEASCRR